MNPVLFWVLFNTFILTLLFVDLLVLHRKEHEVKPAEALRWCGVWVSLALAFNVLVYFWRGSETALQFLTGYLIEYSLSIDNIFVFILVFSYFQVPAKLQHKVLFWGILGALVLRAALILAGIGLMETFHWVIYVFGALLIYSGGRMVLDSGEDVDPERNPALKLTRRILPVTTDYRGAKFFVREAGRLMATPLFIVLVVVETTDLVFAVDSIPAILAISQDEFVVYTSNVFAILGLRSLYFALAGVMKMFRFLKYGLAAVLVFVGLKMCLSGVWHMPVLASLVVVAGILVCAIALSLVLRERESGPSETGKQ